MFDVASTAVSVVGSLNQDLVVLVSRHPMPGETVLGREHFAGLGGKGANQAVAVARLGNRVAMVGKLGVDAAGDEMLDGLRAVGVDTTHVTRQDTAPTGLAVITVDDAAENAIVVSPGANSLLGPSDIEAASSALQNSDVVLAQLEVPLAAVASSVQRCTGTFILNPAPAPSEQLADGILDRVDLLVPNRTELAVLAGTPVPASASDVIASVAALRYSGPVIVTLGSDGAMLIAEGDHELISPPSVEAVDTTGAGDAFCGALADATARGLSLHDATNWAVHAGAFAVTGLGAQGAMPTSEDVHRLMR